MIYNVSNQLEMTELGTLTLGYSNLYPTEYRQRVKSEDMRRRQLSRNHQLNIHETVNNNIAKSVLYLPLKLHCKQSIATATKFTL